ncbi:hypothetical protein CLOM_g22801, partial [Closterium sp. NIES-68]
LNQGQEMLRIFKSYSSRTSILDDFTFYDSRQRAMQERKMRQPHPMQQHPQQHPQQQQQQQHYQHQQQHLQQQHHQQQLQQQRTAEMMHQVVGRRDWSTGGEVGKDSSKRAEQQRELGVQGYVEDDRNDVDVAEKDGSWE